GEHDYHGIFSKPRYFADGVERQMSMGERSYHWRIWDASSGMAVEPAATLFQRLSEKREAEMEANSRTLSGDQEFAFFGERITDYIDADEFKALHGMEFKDYLKQNRALLPRNGSFQFREELRFIDGFDTRYPADSRGIMKDFLVIPPASMPVIPARHNLYSDDLQSIYRVAEIAENEEEKVAEALAAWRSDGKLLSDSLTPALVSRLRSKLQVKESGYYRIEIDCDTPAGVSATATLPLSAGTSKFQYYDLLFD
ncbi:MAG: general secretion pathway protein GspK, partial [Lentisphaeria bacterium]|nr:general secretion pathway protein GspK [Lentisphaeria bacterium]